MADTPTATLPITPAPPVTVPVGNGFGTIPGNSPGAAQPQNQPITPILANGGNTDVKPPTNNTTPTNIPAGWDPQTYANFKVANPGLEPDAEDTARMNGTYVPPGISPDTSADRTALVQAQADYQAQAKNVQDTLTNIQNGTIPLNAGEQAQVDGLKQQFQALIQQQAIQNTGASGLANVRGYQSGAAEYDPTFQAKTIGAIVTAGQNKIADLNVKMASAVAALTQSFKDHDAQSVKDAWAIYQDAAQQRTAALQKTIDDTQKVFKEAQDRQDELNKQAAAVAQKAKDDLYTQVTKPLQDLAQTASNNGAPSDVLQKISSAKSLGDAYIAAGKYAAGGTGDVGNYNRAVASGYTGTIFDFLKAINEAKAAGTTIGKNITVNVPINAQTLQTAIAGQESGSSYSAVNNDSGALGKYQIMPMHLPDIGLTNSPADIAKFLASPDLQDQLYTKIIGDLQTKYAGNTDKILAAYYGGDGAAQIVGTTDADKPQGDKGQYPSINAYVQQVKQRLGDIKQSDEFGWNLYDASAPNPATANNRSDATGKTANDIWQSAIRYGLQGGNVQQFVGGLGSGAQKDTAKNAISGKAAALATAAGVDLATVQQEYKANQSAINKQDDFMNSVDRALTAAENGAAKTQQLFKDKGINPYDSTWANTTLNDLTKKFGDSGDIRAYQSAMAEIGNEYALVFARGGARSVEGNAQAQNIINGNVKLADLQKTLDTLQEIGKVNVAASIDQIKNISAGGGTDAVARFLAYAHGDKTTNQVVQNHQASIQKISDWTSQSKQNNDLYNNAVRLAPDATPEEIMQLLGIQ